MGPIGEVLNCKDLLCIISLFVLLSFSFRFSGAHSFQSRSGSARAGTRQDGNCYSRSANTSPWLPLVCRWCAAGVPERKKSLGCRSYQVNGEEMS